MTDLNLSMETIGLITQAEKRLRARIKDAVDEGERIVFITEKGHLGQALGKEAKNLQMMRDLLKKDVKFVEWDEDKQIFIRNLFKPFDVASIRMETLSVAVPGEMDAAGQPVTKIKIRAIVEVEAKDKGKAIGKGGRNISSIRHIAKRHQEIDEVQVV
ncbi:MAG TPA: NusA-like transcription termination signal-binding factor [Candidatus Thermoplasmatota archaeon]|nr:NusA-like transcription termination signal-binding factor [Candidatus Thermoplasmatota archaeon]